MSPNLTDNTMPIWRASCTKRSKPPILPALEKGAASQEIAGENRPDAMPNS